MPGELSRIWFKKVPLLDFTSLTYHWPLSHQKSQWRRDTTFDLNPTGAVVLFGLCVYGWTSLSEYRPTRITSSPRRKMRSIGGKVRASRGDRTSWNGVNRIEAVKFSVEFGFLVLLLGDRTAGPLGAAGGVAGARASSIERTWVRGIESVRGRITATGEAFVVVVPVVALELVGCPFATSREGDVGSADGVDGFVTTQVVAG